MNEEIVAEINADMRRESGICLEKDEVSDGKLFFIDLFPTVNCSRDCAAG